MSVLNNLAAKPSWVSPDASDQCESETENTSAPGSVFELLGEATLQFLEQERAVQRV